jgi:hypothetical protein
MTLSERAVEMVPIYEKLFAERGRFMPADPLEYHLYHLVRYWSRLIGFCRQSSSDPRVLVEGDLGACIKVGSDFAHRLINSGSPIYEHWQKYWMQTKTVLNDRPVLMDQIESAVQALNECCSALKYDPWGKPPKTSN